MSEQNYATHRHNPKLTSIAFFFLVASIVALSLRWFDIGGRLSFAVGIGALIGATMVLITISRSYTTRLQDRIIKLEMKVRAASLLSPAQQVALAKLSNKQIVALRFASDEELPALLERAGREQLMDDQIKRAIKTWVSDRDRT